MSDMLNLKRRHWQLRQIAQIRSALNLVAVQRLADDQRQERAALYAESAQRAVSDEALARWDAARAARGFDPLFVRAASHVAAQSHGQWNTAATAARAATAQRAQSADDLLHTIQLQDVACQATRRQHRVIDAAVQEAQLRAVEDGVAYRQWRGAGQ